MATRILSTDGLSGARSSGSKVQAMALKVDVLSTDTSGDILVIAPISGDYIVTSVNYYTAGVTGLTSAALGVYQAERVGGDVIDVDMFDAAIDLSASGTDAGLTGVVPADRYKTIRELAGTDAGNPNEFNLALTLNATPSADGTVTIVVEMIQS